MSDSVVSLPEPEACVQNRGLFVGLATVDLIQRVDALPGPNEKTTSSRAELAAGGPATGAAVTFAGLGGEACLVTALGPGPIADLVRVDLRQARIDVVDAYRGGSDASISAVAVEEMTGARSVISRDARNVQVTVPERLDAHVATAGVVLLDGHHPDLAVAAAESARRHEVPVVLDAGSWKPALSTLLPQADVVLCSEVFAMADGRSPQDLLDDGVPLVAVTRGPEPVLWWTLQRSGQVEVPALQARDTLGAGDAFHGAAAYAISNGVAEPRRMLGFAAGVASLRVGHVGPRSWLQDGALEDLRERL